MRGWACGPTRRRWQSWRRLVQAAHADLARQFPDAQLIGFHGQTLAHDPRGRGTHQAGDGAALARMTDRPVVWDFRSEDVRQGGEGAPLVPFFHWACANWAVGQGRLPAAPVAFLNLGGVGNISWVDPTAPAPETAGACVAFDTGPANAPLERPDAPAPPSVAGRRRRTGGQRHRRSGHRRGVPG